MQMEVGNVFKLYSFVKEGALNYYFSSYREMALLKIFRLCYETTSPANVGPFNLSRQMKEHGLK